MHPESSSVFLRHRFWTNAALGLTNDPFQVFNRITMTAPQVEFLALIEQRAKKLNDSSDWLPQAMKVIHLVPDTYRPDAASLVFCRWLLNEEPHVHDVLMLRLLAP